MLDKHYRPEDIEKQHYDEGEAAGSFNCGQQPDALPYTIVIPPPNVTGSLHMGHALNNTLQDILIRQHRMAGRDTLWQPGTDHAGIATQMVVERRLEAAGQTRHDLGREDFVRKIWAWKKESGGTITRQLRRLGASCDWSRERFTMDEGLSRAVRKVFVALFRKRLIYRDKRLVNWDPKLHTAISDLEVRQHEKVGKLWYFRYPVEATDAGGSESFVTVATTRPETMLADTGVAVHPDDERYQKLVGRHCILPIVGRKLPVVADEYADPEKGSGAVKITPAHDFNDFEVGRRHDLKMINVLDENACLNENAPEAFQGLDRYEAREKVVAIMDGLGLLEKVEDNPMMVPYGDRSEVVIEPWLMDQWFVDARRLAGPAITAVEQGRTTFIPEQWENTYYEWMRNIQPWCISRQLWWGHQIPAWFGPDGEIFVEETEEQAYAAARAHYGTGDASLERDPDVLDTWFSSALWPFSTLGWPDETPELARYYPTDVLITGFDIIFFWVARMMMMGIEFMGDVPFHTVYIHALVRDKHGQKMSKSRGNVIDPLDLIEKYGADALRFTLTAFATQGRDVRLEESRVAGYRNFCTKIWNAARFCQMNGCRPVDGFDPATVSLTINKWVIGKLKGAQDQANAAIASYRFNDLAGALYQFAWGTFCDWYVELAKPILQTGHGTTRDETRATAAWVLDQLLHLLHPVMPFITEELWQSLGDNRPYSLVLGPWPTFGSELVDPVADKEIDWLVRLISQIRAVRAEMNVPPASRLPLHYLNAETATRKRLADNRDLIERLARIDGIAPDEQEAGKGCVQIIVDDTTFSLPLGGVVDLGAERLRLKREIGKLDQEIARFDKKLAKESFVSRAPRDVVETERERRTEAVGSRRRLEEALSRLASAL